VQQRIGDKRVLALVKAFLKAGILSEDGTLRDSHTGAPQGGILTPPAQWATWGGLLVGVTVCDLLGRGGGAAASGDGEADDDAFGS
jgi:hypothetical protein